jgi:DNA-binding transcriptional LysR family regulator
MIEKLELNHLRMLSALYKLGTVSAAAESLDVSQQAVSLQLKRIREILGDPCSSAPATAWCRRPMAS